MSSLHGRHARRTFSNEVATPGALLDASGVLVRSLLGDDHQGDRHATRRSMQHGG
ncbi:hypothetical protein [Sorangium sp. So ce1099]|uniref:hypothetical protein n=1 Tax=Sorangium sp. So ce1099 TaxID=3133331 RepID=UPI003F63B49D